MLGVSRAEVQCCVIRKYPDLGFDVVAQVVDVDEEESWAKDGSLRYTGDHLARG